MLLVMENLYIQREIEPVVQHYVPQFPAIALSGPRQSGKSTLLKHLFSKTYRYITFDDPLVIEQARSDPVFFLDNAGDRIILDEIQYVPEILSYIKMRIDDNRNKKGRFIFTGSQKFPLIKNLGDSLAGRIGLLELLPFSSEEKKQIPHPGISFDETENLFVHACLAGSFPEPVIAQMDINAWYSSYLQTYLERDIRTIHNIGGLRDFQLFLKLLASRCAQTLNLSGFSRDTGISIQTLKRWISVLEAGLVIYLLPPYYNNLGKRITKSPKLYFLDCGLVCHLAGIRSKEHLLNGPMAGTLFENFCIQETVKTYMNRGFIPGIFYTRTNNNLEIDLIIESMPGELHPVEIKLTKTPKQSMELPVKRFRELFSALSVKKGRLLCLSSKSIPLSRDTDVVSFQDYLLWLKEIIRS